MSLPSFCSLPVDVLNAIALALPCREFGRLLQTNRHIHDTLDTHWIWHQRFVARMGQGFLAAKLKQVEEDAPAPTTMMVDGEEEEEVDLRKTSAASKEQLIEWYRGYTRTVIPARDMTIIHMNGTFLWSMQPNTTSVFGEMARLGAVNWLDVSALFHGVVPGRYYVQWGLIVNSITAVQYTLFRAIALMSHEFPPWDNMHPDTIRFTPQRASAFIQHTTSPTRNRFQAGPMIFQLPAVLQIGPEHPTVFVQLKDHDNFRSKCAMSIDYVRLVRVDDWDKVVVPEPVDPEWEAEEMELEADRARVRREYVHHNPAWGAEAAA
ncbi:hypothetical protein BGW39_009049 [Mortierella sp. 14UC]|nr:hypothetical protein BGW39_009049 [Mortierella sp. 14UC]